MSVLSVLLKHSGKKVSIFSNLFLNVVLKEKSTPDTKANEESTRNNLEDDNTQSNLIVKCCCIFASKSTMNEMIEMIEKVDVTDERGDKSVRQGNKANNSPETDKTIGAEIKSTEPGEDDSNMNIKPILNSSNVNEKGQMDIFSPYILRI